MTDSHQKMTSQRPYLLRALLEWINDNEMTPHILVDAMRSDVRVPPSTIADGKVILNVADRAVAQLQMDNEAISFTARFDGVSYPVYVPMTAVQAVYARESGQGMAFPEELVHTESNDSASDDDPPETPTPEASGNKDKRAHLRVVK